MYNTLRSSKHRLNWRVIEIFFYVRQFRLGNGSEGFDEIRLNYPLQIKKKLFK